jgi:hypothetical protein
MDASGHISSGGKYLNYTESWGSYDISIVNKASSAATFKIDSSKGIYFVTTGWGTTNHYLVIDYSGDTPTLGYYTNLPSESVYATIEYASTYSVTGTTALSSSKALHHHIL